MTVRHIASVVAVEKSSVSRILCAYMDSGPLSPNRKGKCRIKRKTAPHTDQLLLRNSKVTSNNDKYKPSKRFTAFRE
jgi:hypothetical protein